MVDLHLQGDTWLASTSFPKLIQTCFSHQLFSWQFSHVLFRCEAMSFPEKQAREAWTSTGGDKEEEGNEEEKEPAIVDRV